MGEKTEQPTPKKLRDSREEGQVAKTPSIGKVLALAGVFELVLGTRNTWRSAFQEWIEHALRMAASADGTQPYYLQAVVSLPVFDAFMTFSMAVIFTAAVIDIAAGFAQVGVEPAPEGMVHGQALDPVSNLTNMFSAQQWITLIVNIFKVAVIGICAWVALYNSFDSLIQSASGTTEQLFNAAVSVVAYAERMAILLLVIFAAIDWVIAYKQFMKQMMMSKEDIDQERKEQYGSREVRQYRRRLSRELTSDNQPAQKAKKKANAVVTNPTHFAIALRFMPEECPLPVVLARGADLTAQEIVIEARAQGIPIIRSVWLARTLYSVGIEDSPIPRVALQATAEVYKAIFAIVEQGGSFDDVIELDNGDPAAQPT
jgi:type III secretion protein U